VADLHVAILPGAGEDTVTVYLTASSNVIVPPFLTFPPGVSLVHMILQAVSEGPAFVTFSSEGYIDFTDNFVVQDLECSANETYNLDSTQCVACPAINGKVCLNKGECTYSTVDKYKARCVCDYPYAGAYCELSTFYSTDIFYFDSEGNTFEYYDIPGVIYTEIVVPPELIQDNDPLYGGDGAIYIRGASSSAPFFPIGSLPTITNFRTVILPPGFGVDATYSDNTIYDILDYPLTVTFHFDKTVISQAEFTEMSLYYYNVTLKNWVPAISTCSSLEQLLVEDLTSLSIQTNLCVVGRYQFFAFVPIPQNPLVEPVFVYNDYNDDHQGDYQFPTTGGSGVQQQLPPQPHLPVVANDPSPPRNLDEEFNGSSFVAPSYYLIPILLVLSLLF
jgi:hypothetical protein